MYFSKPKEINFEFYILFQNDTFYALAWPNPDRVKEHQRPINSLCTWTKILEKVAYKQSSDFVNANILTTFQLRCRIVMFNS